MNWMKRATGKNLGDAVNKWLEIKKETSKANSKKIIAPQFEYNTYIRDFMEGNPNKTLQDAIKCWKIKKANPGDNKYAQTDLLGLKSKSLLGI